ncbi:hypothetical protein I307_03591 [Cryptococcus deuterogattii 99/473]|uniref:Unplaced genomic scaffold supercont1.1, whole genome shotgun sequence n=1 Tax=Cryptococcus deuterogattii Ram5 TaxID=1296110 RepID=A0A0D0U540_9TREE|nr:hypothetical protein I313_00170 [Cryptococcus deuterogattii Ram5]KIY56854.1 hypothetical protein I307_03591 [Cryptococcus deuterogattii 99/473]
MPERHCQADDGAGRSGHDIISPSSEHSATCSPPPPPPHFNPPAGFPADSPSETISPPGSASIASPTKFFPLDVAPFRPSSPSIHRISTESVPTPRSEASSVSSNQSAHSEGGDHLVEMRERLRSESLTSSTPPGRSRASSHATHEGSRLSVTSSNASSETVIDDTAEEQHYERSGPMRRLSAGVLAGFEEAPDLPVEHAWDSVWPAASSIHRHVLPEPGLARFPMAPVSPFVTPSFSPAVIPTTSSSRRPKSPSLESHDPISPMRSSAQSPGIAPFRFSPRMDANSPTADHPHTIPDLGDYGRRPSISSDAALIPKASPTVGAVPITTSKHGRSLSTSSQHSPRALPPQNQPQIPPLSGPANRLTNPGASPPLVPSTASSSSALKGRPRGHSLSSVARNKSGLEPLTQASIRSPSPLTGFAHPAFNLSPHPSPGSSPRNSPRFSPHPSPKLSSHTEKQKPAPAAESIHEIIKSLSPSSVPPPIALPPPVTQPQSSLSPPSSSSPHIPSHRSPSPPLYVPLARPAIFRRAISDYESIQRPNNRSTPVNIQRTLSDSTETGKADRDRDKIAYVKTPGVTYGDMLGPVISGGSRLSDKEMWKRMSPRRSPLSLPSLSPVTGGVSDEHEVVQSPMAMTHEEKADLEQAHMERNRVSSPIGDRQGQVPITSEGQIQNPYADWPGEPITSTVPAHDQMNEPYSHEIGLVDEGDVLPPADAASAVPAIGFDEEGLNTVERIFLLSRAEYPFHRAYIARVLGDLLNEVDPCESVEYVLPLLSGLSMDEDESVKEAFAQELHRILWYFYSTCKLQLDEVEGQGEYGVDQAGMMEQAEQAYEQGQQSAEAEDAAQKTVTITSEGVDVVHKPTPAEIDADSIVVDVTPLHRQSFNSSGSTTQSSSGSSRPIGSSNISSGDDAFDLSTPGSSVSEGTAYSPGMFINPHADDEDGSIVKEGVLVDRPPLQVSFFTPLIGSLLLSQNPVVSESVRNGVVNILARLRGQGELTVEVWGQSALQPEPDERRTFQTQMGPHQHDLRPFTPEDKLMVECELLQNIIIGMGNLSTDTSEMDFGDSEAAEDQETFQAQLIQEAITGQATSINLIGAVCETYTEEEVLEHGFVDELLRAGSEDGIVRAEAAVAMSSLAKRAPVEQVHRMIPLFEQLCDDVYDQVRQSVCMALPALCKRIESLDYRREFAIKSIQTLTSASEDVRMSALEMLGEMIYIFHEDPRGPPQELLDIYLDDSEVEDGTTDSDWDTIAIFNIRDLFGRLQARAGEKVKATTAACLHELAKILTPSQVAEDLLPVYSALLKGTEEVRERVFEHVEVIIASVPTEIGWELFQNLANSWQEGTLGGWRAREKLAWRIPSFLQTFAGWGGQERVLEMMKAALLDPFAAVRDGATSGIPKSYEVITKDPKSHIAYSFHSILLELGRSSSFKQRLTFVRCLREFVKPPPNRNAFEDYFLPQLSPLACDVVDIRLSLAQIIADLFVVGAYYADVAQGIPQQIRELATGLAKDEAVDVRNTVRKVDLSSFEKGKGVPYEIEDTSAPNRAAKPDNMDEQTISDEAPTSRNDAAGAIGMPSTGSTSASIGASESSNSSAITSASLSRSSSSQSSVSAKDTPTRNCSPRAQIPQATEDVSHDKSESFYSSEDLNNEETPTLSQKEWFGEQTTVELES